MSKTQTSTPEERDGSGFSRCPHCRQTTLSGTHTGCSGCRRVKHTPDGRRNSSQP